MEAWDAEAALQSLVEETETIDGGDAHATAKRLLQQALPTATQSVVHIALHSPNERLRLEASKVVMDRCLGTVAASDPLGRPADALETVLAKIFENANVSQDTSTQ